MELAASSSSTAPDAATPQNTTGTTTTGTSGTGGAHVVENKEFELPPLTLQKIVKSILPDGSTMSKEAKQAFSKSTGLFIIYLTSCANDFARERGRQIVQPQDVLDALKELDFEEFVEPLNNVLNSWRAENAQKNAIRKESSKSKKDETTPIAPDDNAITPENTEVSSTIPMEQEEASSA